MYKIIYLYYEVLITGTLRDFLIANQHFFWKREVFISSVGVKHEKKRGELDIIEDQTIKGA